MKAIDILKWICENPIDGEVLHMIDIPEEGDNECDQNEEWWYSYFGMCPPSPVPAGKYLYFYTTQVDGPDADPDAEIEIPERWGFSYIHFYKIDD